jgi:hypothetical protein
LATGELATTASCSDEGLLLVIVSGLSSSLKFILTAGRGVDDADLRRRSNKDVLPRIAFLVTIIILFSGFVNRLFRC